MSPLKSFNFEGREQPVSYVETTHVTEGVDCDVYTFDGDPSKDLGIIRISPGSKTPLQKVLTGDRTIEGYISGLGKLTVIQVDGKRRVYEMKNVGNEVIEVDIKIGEFMQWEADKNSSLLVYEICFPPYQTGRYENIK
jgi:hypothetical protein